MEIKNVSDENVSRLAADIVRLNFNPNGNNDVQRIKTLTATLVDEVMRHSINAPEEVKTAITAIQTASMWSVLAATSTPKAMV